MEETQVAVPDAGTSDATPVGTATEATAAGAGTETASAPASTDGTVSDGASAATETTTDSESTTARSERRQRQREARKQAAVATPADQPAPEPVKTREEIAAEIRAQDAADQAAQQRQRQEQQRYAQWIGDDRANPNDPQSQTRYQQLWSEANTPIPDGDDKFFTDETRALVQRVNVARSKLQELNERRGMLGEVYGTAQHAARLEAKDWLGNELERGLSEIGLDPKQVIAAIKDPNVAIPTIVKQISAAKDAEYQPQLDELEDELAAKDSEIDALKRQLGGAAPQALRGGVAAGVNGHVVYTRETLRDMLSTPEGIAEYRRNRAEIERQETAGLIR